MNPKRIINLTLITVAIVAFATVGYWAITYNQRGGSGITVDITCLSKNYVVKSCAIGGVLVVKTAEWKEVTRQNASRSTFKLSLEPGDYFVIPLPDDTNEYHPINNPQSVQIKSGQFIKLKIRYWDGKRW